VVLPAAPFGMDGQRTLDGVSAEEIGEAHAGRVHIAASSAELFEVLASADA